MHRYLDVYDPIVVQWLGREIKLLQIGIYKGFTSVVARLFSLLLALLGSILTCRSSLCLESVFKFFMLAN